MTAGIEIVGDSLDIGLDPIPPYDSAAEEILSATSTGDDDDDNREAARSLSVTMPRHILHIGGLGRTSSSSECWPDACSNGTGRRQRRPMHASQAPHWSRRVETTRTTDAECAFSSDILNAKFFKLALYPSHMENDFQCTGKLAKLEWCMGWTDHLYELRRTRKYRMVDKRCSRGCPEMRQLNP